MRYSISGSNVEAIYPATASDHQLVLGKAPGTGRTFWLRGVSIIPNATYGPLRIVDASEGATVSGGGVSIALEPASNENTVVHFSAPGLRFATACVCFLDASGEIPIGGITGWGYED